ncbi:hypothetical protein P7C73_g2845, partial [Tremellales sp. Uapishka_1]
MAMRESPFPLILVRSRGLGIGKQEEEEECVPWSDWSAMFAEKGYTTLELDITGGPIEAASNALLSQIRLLAVPFPPILISSGTSCLLTQTYIGDHGASGIVLLNPPEDAVMTFTYEPLFPILVLEDKGKNTQSRLRGFAEKGMGRGGKGVCW